MVFLIPMLSGHSGCVYNSYISRKDQGKGCSNFLRKLVGNRHLSAGLCLHLGKHNFIHFTLF